MSTDFEQLNKILAELEAEHKHLQVSIHHLQVEIEKRESEVRKLSGSDFTGQVAHILNEIVKTVEELSSLVKLR